MNDTNEENEANEANDTNEANEVIGANEPSLKISEGGRYNDAKTKALLLQARQGNRNAITLLVENNTGLIWSVVRRFLNRGTETDDLFQIGSIGLMKAIKNFDTSFDVMFSTYAVPMIMGEIRRYLRDNNSIRVSRSLRELAYKAMRVKEDLTNKNFKEPSIDEIAKILGVSREDVVLSLEASIEPISLYEPVFSDGGDTVYVMDQIGDKNDQNNWLEGIALKEAINKLSDREKKILTQRFFDGMSQMEVAAEVGISQAQVSRLEKSALARIKNQMF